MGGLPKDKKLAYLQRKLEQEQNPRVQPAHQSSLKRQDMATNPKPATRSRTFAANAASELYTDVWPTPQAFQHLKVDEVEIENERVAEMLDLVRKSPDGKHHFHPRRSRPIHRRS